MSESRSSAITGVQKGNKTSLTKTPIVRIGLKEKKESVEFKLNGKFSVFNNEGVAILKNMITPNKWRIKVEFSYPAKYAFNILLKKYDDYRQAEDLMYELIEKGLGAQITTIGDEFYYDKKVINDNRQYWVIIDGFNKEQEARFFAELNLKNYKTTIIREKIKEPGAVIEIYDFDFEKVAEAENVLRIVPETDNVIANLYDFTNEPDEQQRKAQYRSFQGVLEFRCDDDGKLIIINETPIEKYVESVVAYAVPLDLPRESFKALAMTIRSKSIAGLRIKHHNDPFDLCATAHCNYFVGIKNNSENVTSAIKETVGEVIIKEQNIYDADFNMVCGGVTEQKCTAELAAMNSEMTSAFDSMDGELVDQFGDLSDENNIRKWIDTEPAVYCNLISANGFNQFQKYFRWETTFSRKELEDIISEKENRLIGVLYDIIPIKRNKAGRLVEMEIIASNVNLVLSSEAAIRGYLAPQMLNSSCFYILKEYDEEGLPFAFTFRGAGNGHGVGMCVAGAISMANEGKNYKLILKHYFKETTVKKIY